MSIINEALKKAAQERGNEKQWMPQKFKPTPIKVDFSRKELLEEELIEERKESFFSSKKKYYVLFFVLGVVVLSLAVFRGWENKKYQLKTEDVNEITLKPLAPSFSKVEKTVLSFQNASSDNPSGQVSNDNELPFIELTGIMMENPPRALVNGQFVMVGDKVSGVKILKIYPDHVVFRYRKKNFKKFIF